MSYCNPIDGFIATNPKCARYAWLGFVTTLIAFLLSGIYIILKDQNSITGASLLLTGSLGLMFVIILYTIHCVLGPGLLPR
jgi:hypothetical protein